MADPLSAWAAVGAAGSLIQLVDFSTKLVKETYELMHERGNASKSNAMLEKFTLMHSNLADQAIHAANSQRPLSQSGQAIDHLARECREASGDLLKLLDELKTTGELHGPRRVWQSARKAQRSLQKRKTIEQKQKYITELTGQLSTALLLDLRSSQLSGLEDVYNRVGEAETRNAALIAESRDSIIKSSKWTHDRRRYIVESLRFPEMHLRRDAIPEAYAKTLSWLFTDSSPFRSWLTSPNKVFWFSGKAGSGKSTAMKYVASHARTKELLSTWANSSQVTIAQNYMWNPGLSIQHNEEGMLQELLFHILRADAELASMVTKLRWHDEPTNLHKRDNWTRAELLEALHCVFQNSRHPNYFCLFIDGLDEYEGEHARLIALIMTFAKYENVKVCISSRPWNVFRNAFGHLSDKMYVHELTKGDIYTYVTGELSKVLNFDPIAEELVSAIVSKAKGVFLWVYLVVRSLREGYEEGDNVEIMRQRVHEFPADLEGYFKHMLKRLSKTYRSHTIKALSLAVKILGQDGLHRIQDCDSFLPLWLLSQGRFDAPNFAVEYEPHHATVPELQEMSEGTRKHLNACCKDFLYVTETSRLPAIRDAQGCSLDHNPKVEFLHRTVYDFLHSADMQEILDKEAPAHFQDSLFPVHVALAQDKVKGIHGEHFCQSCSRALCSAIKLTPSTNSSLRTMIAFEQLAVELLDFSCTEECCHQALSDQNLLDDMCIIFASYKLRKFIQNALYRLPDCIWRMDRVDNSEVLRQSLGLSARRPYPTAQIDLALLSMILEAGEYREFHLRKMARRLCEKALNEASSWTNGDVVHVAKVIQILRWYGLHLDVVPDALVQILKRYLPRDSEVWFPRYSSEQNNRDPGHPAVWEASQIQAFWGARFNAY